MRPGNAARRSLVVAFLACVALAFPMATGASAHAVLLSANPSPNIGLGNPPKAVQLRLSEPLQVPPSSIRVLDRDGEDLALGTRRLSSDPQSMETKVRPLAAGVYKVEWKSVSVLDGHTIRGSYFFGVGQAPPGAPAEVRSGVLSGAGLPGIVARVVQDAALILLLGLAALALLQRSSRFGQAAPGLFVRVAVVALAGAAATSLADAVAASGWAPREIGSFLTGSVPGWARLAAVLATGLAVLAAVARSVAGVGILSASALVAVAISGHAAATSHPVPFMAANAAHVVAAGLWLGVAAAIALLWRTIRPERSDILHVIARVSPFAIASAVLVAGTGVANAFGQLAVVSDAWGTGYGRVLLAKSGALVVASALGARHSFVLRRRLALATANPGQEEPARRIFGALSGEGWSAATAVMLAVILVAFPNPPAQEARAEEQESTVPALHAVRGAEFVTLAERDGPHVLGLVIAPPRPGLVRLAVQFVPGTEIDLDRVRIAITATDPDGSATRYATRACGPGCYVGSAVIQASGAWSFTVEADDPDRTTVSFRLPLPTSNGERVLENLRRAWERLRSLQIDETFLSGTSLRIDTRYRYEAPDRTSIETSTGRTEINVGDRSYRRESPSQPWKMSKNPFPTKLPFPFLWQRATEEPHLLEDVTVDGRAAYVLAVFDPFGIWYRITVDKLTFRPLRDHMRAVGHFMNRSYSRFDEQLGIKEPAA